ncbi:plasmid mobilization protein [Leucobacter sp. HY1910]
MSDITEMIDRAASDAENHQGGPGKIRGQRRAGAATPAVLSVRLTAEQLAELTARAEAAGQPTSAYARSILLNALGAGENDALAAKLEAVLRHTLAPEMLARAS